MPPIPALRIFAILALSLLGSFPAQASQGRSSDSVAVATFAGGSFWCLEPAFEKIPGVLGVVAGYIGGLDSTPTFDRVIEGKTGHVEAVQVRFNPKTVSYAKLLDTFWRNVDPTRKDGQFTDEGSQFRTVIYFHNPNQKKLAQVSKRMLEKTRRYGKNKSVVTEIDAVSTFYPAEQEHQDYYKKNPARYQTYRKFSGRDAFFKKIWGAAPAD